MRTSYLNRIIGVLGTLLVLLAFSACNPQNEAPGEATLTVSVEDATSKLIGPDADNVDISHYRITVSNDNGAIAVSDLLPKNNAYTLTGLVPGEWDILAEGYVKPDASTEAVKVAGKKESIQLSAGSNPVKITLDTLDKTPAGTVSITLLLPPEAVSSGSFQYWYSVVDMAGDEVMSSGSEVAPITGTCTGNEGSFDITGINQGSYLLFVSVNTPEGVVTAVDAMRLIAGLNAVGTLDFSGSSDTPTLDTGLTVEDAIGNILVFGDLDGTVFNITGADLELGLPNAYEYHWYLDGSEWDGYVSETEKGESETTFAVGNLEGISATRHVLSVVAVIPGTQIGVGSVELIVNKVGLAIEGDDEGIKIIPDGEFTVGVMAFKDSVFIPKGGYNSIAFLFLDKNGEIISVDNIKMAISPAATLQYIKFCKETAVSGNDEDLAKVDFILDSLLEPFENGMLPSSFLSLPGFFFAGSNSQIATMSQLEMAMAQSGITDYTKVTACYNSYPLDLDVSSETDLYAQMMFSAENCGTLLFDSAPFEDNLSSYFSLFGQSLFPVSSSDNENPLFFPFEIKDRNIEWIPEFLDLCGEDLREKNIRYKGLVISGEENIVAFKEKVAAAKAEEDLDARFDMLVSLVDENSDKIIDLPGSVDGTDKTAVVYPLIYMTGSDGTEKFCYDLEDPQGIEMTDFELKEITTDDGKTAYSITGLKYEYSFVQPDPEEFVIPDTIMGIDVVEIESRAFHYSTITGNLILPSGLKRIGNNAFTVCKRLTGRLDFPNGLKSIEGAAFLDCTGFTGELVFPDGLEKLGHSAFEGCSNLTSVSIPGSVTSINMNAFEQCDSLTSVILHDGLTSIEQAAFRGCRSLANIDIPDSVIKLGPDAFSGCVALTNIDIPDGVTIIYGRLFYNCSSLTSIDIPEGVTKIIDGAFANCSNLQNIDIPASVMSIGAEVFRNCSSLKNVTIPKNVNTMGALVFSGCTALSDIYIEAESIPDTWDPDWLGDCAATLHLGATRPETT